MRYYRYMSIEEMRLMACGVDIIGHRHDDALTSSRGVCFLGEKTLVESTNDSFEFSPVQCYEFLAGIVSKDVLVEFESDMQLKHTVGVYASPFSDDWDDMALADEYCIPSYNREIMRPVRYTVDFGYYSKNTQWWDFN